MSEKTQETPEASQTLSDGGTTERAEPQVQSDTASVGDLLTRPSTNIQYKFLSALYGLIGLGFGILMIIIDNQLLGEESAGADMIGGIIFVVMFALLIFMGPFVSAFTGIEISRRLTDARQAIFASGVGNAIGFVVMVVVATLFINSVSGGGSSSELFNLGDLIVPLVALSIPTGIVGAGSVYIREKFR